MTTVPLTTAREATTRFVPVRSTGRTASWIATALLVAFALIGVTAAGATVTNVGLTSLVLAATVLRLVVRAARRPARP